MDVNATVKLQFDQGQLSIKLLLSSEEDKKDSRGEKKAKAWGESVPAESCVAGGRIVIRLVCYLNDVISKENKPIARKESDALPHCPFLSSDVI